MKKNIMIAVVGSLCVVGTVWIKTISVAQSIDRTDTQAQLSEIAAPYEFEIDRVRGNHSKKAFPEDYFLCGNQNKTAAITRDFSGSVVIVGTETSIMINADAERIIHAYHMHSPSKGFAFKNIKIGKTELINFNCTQRVNIKWRK